MQDTQVAVGGGEVEGKTYGIQRVRGTRARKSSLTSLEHTLQLPP